MATAKKAISKTKITAKAIEGTPTLASSTKPAKSGVSKSDLHKALREYFGFEGFKGNQEAIILNLLAGNDTFVIKPTGGGKSLCYQLPAIISEG